MKIIIFILISGAFFGAYLYLFDQRFHVIRLLPPFILVIGFVSSIKMNRDAQILLTYFTFYFIYTLILSLVNLSNIYRNDLINLTFLYLFIVALILLVSNNPLLYLKVFKFCTWMFVAINIGVWGYEVLFHQHLSYSLAADFKPNYYYHPTTTFFTNPNDFAAIFSLSSMYLLTVTGSKTVKVRLLKILLIVLTFAVFYTTKARICFIAFSFFLSFYLQIWKAKTLFFVGLSICVVALYVTVKFDLDWQGLLNLDSTNSGSISIRRDLYYHGLLSIVHSYGLGFGVVGHHYYYEKIAHLEYTDPHNFLLELFIGGGVIIVSLYCLLTIYVLLRLLKEGNRLILAQFILYNFILLSSSTSLFLWPHYLFFIAYIFFKNGTQSELYFEKNRF